MDQRHDNEGNYLVSACLLISIGHSETTLLTLIKPDHPGGTHTTISDTRANQPMTAAGAETDKLRNATCVVAPRLHRISASGLFFSCPKQDLTRNLSAGNRLNGFSLN
ncbi:hypothetical protein [Blastomonas aquatica]|uniref:hypothetical protein n=1 Tax=Blastomonas aquatica TaxID=1510276 RepID=UPI001668A9C8|nr:hypothetical protein [Blastomonas aquatica]